MTSSQELIGKKVSSWYKSNGRKELPWRINPSPYKVWISELILQQTQVATGLRYFKSFLSAYPNLNALKHASENDILKLWKGLGYYRRASYIFKAKEMIFTDFNGVFPDNFQDLLKLPGVGKSTAGAIMSLAYNLPYPILDGNVKRVISRLFHVDKFNENEFWEFSELMLDKNDPFSFQQGIMDIGATICTKASPLCFKCPLQDECISFHKNSFPSLAKKQTAKKELFINFKLITDNKRIVLIKNEELGFWKDLWIFPYEVVHKNDAEYIHNLSHRKLNIQFLPSADFKNFSSFTYEEALNLTTPKPISDKLIKICL